MSRPARLVAMHAHPDRELHLDVIDATCLLMSRRVAIELIDHPETAWDHALQMLVAEDREGP